MTHQMEGHPAIEVQARQYVDSKLETYAQEIIAYLDE